jgi:flagellar biosynthesis/type III secretory pathway protein FliH
MGIIETIKKIAREEALEEGLELGMEKGIEKGIEKGAEQKSREFVRNLLQNTDFDDAKIASLSGVTTAFVEKVKKESNG